MKRTAHCSCGSLRVETTEEPEAVIACHCRACQRRSGAVLPVTSWFRKTAAQTSGPASLFVREAAEGRKIRYHFCPTCGTTLYWLADRRPDHIGIAVGAFADADFPPPDSSIWEESKHAWIGFEHEVQHSQEALPVKPARA